MSVLRVADVLIMANKNKVIPATTPNAPPTIQRKFLDLSFKNILNWFIIFFHFNYSLATDIYN